MVYNFDLNDLQVINILLFDASVELEDLVQLDINKPIQFKVERRSLDNVKREKVLFWNKTTFGGMFSIIRLSGIGNIKINGLDDKFSDNHFIEKLAYNHSNKILELITVFGLIVSFTVEQNFKGELIDIEESDFGAGQSFSSVGFSEKEWNELKNKTT